MGPNRREVTRAITIVGLVLLVAVAHAAALSVSIESTSAVSGSQASIPVVVAGASNLGAMDLAVTYDPAILTFTGVDLGSLSTNGMIESNAGSPGTIKIGFVDTRGVTGDGPLFVLKFTVIGKQGATSSITPQVTGAWNTNLVDVSTTTSAGVLTVGSGGKTPLSIVPVVAALGSISLMARYHSMRPARRKEKQP